MYIGLHVKYGLFLLDFNEAWIFSEEFRRIFKYQILWKSSSASRVVPCGQTEEQTDTEDEANSRFSQFCERA